LAPWVGSRVVVLAWLVAMAVLATGAFAFHRSLTRTFDAVVGRPHLSMDGESRSGIPRRQDSGSR